MVAVESRRRPGLESAERKPSRARVPRRGLAPRFDRRPSCVLPLAYMDQPGRKPAGGHNARARLTSRPYDHLRRKRDPLTASSRGFASMTTNGRVAYGLLHGAASLRSLARAARTRRSLAPIEYAAGCRRDRPPDPSCHQAHRSRGQNGLCRARQWGNCSTSRRL